MPVLPYQLLLKFSTVIIFWFVILGVKNNSSVFLYSYTPTEVPSIIVMLQFKQLLLNTAGLRKNVQSLYNFAHSFSLMTIIWI